MPRPPTWADMPLELRQKILSFVLDDILFCDAGNHAERRRVRLLRKLCSISYALGIWELLPLLQRLDRRLYESTVEAREAYRSLVVANAAPLARLGHAPRPGLAITAAHPLHKNHPAVPRHIEAARAALMQAQSRAALVADALISIPIRGEDDRSRASLC